MPEVDNVSLRIDATAQQAIASLKKLRSGLFDVEAGTEDATNATKASAKAVATATKYVGNLAAAYKKMGLTSLAKEMKPIQQSAARVKGVAASIKDAAKAAEYFDKNGMSGMAAYVRELGNDPLKSEFALRANAEQQKQAMALQKEAAAEFANGEKLVAKIAENAKVNAAKEAASKQKEIAKDVFDDYKAIADEIEDLVNEKAKKEAEALKENERLAKISADSDRAYRELTNNAIVEAVRKREAEISAIRKQTEKQERIGAQALAKARAEAEREAAAERKQAEKESAAAAKAQAKELEKAQSIASKFGKSLSAPFRKIGELFAAFKRIALYRAIRTAIRGITAAVKEGMTNLYNYSQTVGTAFAPAVDNLRRHVLWLKNAFATALRPVIEALIPIIQRLVDWLVKAADFIAQVMSVLTGKVDDNNRYTKAVLTDLEESNERAKELRRTLLGFDEINRLDGDTGSGESNNAGLMFTQADVSPEAVAVAEKVQTVLEKVREIIANTDWDAVLRVIEALMAVKGIIKVYNALKNVFTVVKGIFSALGVGGTVVAAVILAFALFGDKIQTTLEGASKSVKKFSDDLAKKLEFSSTLSNLVKLFGDFVADALEAIGKLAGAIYKLCHGDFEGALEDAKGFALAFLKLIAHAIVNVANIILGIVEDIVNAILFAARWLWNNAFQPFFNDVARIGTNIYIWVHNAILDLRIAVLEVIKWILDKIDWALQQVIGWVNDIIASFNEMFGTEIDPIEIHIDTTWADEKIAELESRKLEPLAEDVELVPKWKDPTKLKLQFDTTAIDNAIDRLGQKTNRLGAALTSIVRATGGSGAASTSISMYASGGFPTMGSVFVAGERGAGAEWVGDINGRTSVLNAEQMASAIYGAMSAALANNPQGGDIYLDGEVIYRSVVNRNNTHVRSTGRAALLT